MADSPLWFRRSVGVTIMTKCPSSHRPGPAPHINPAQPSSSSGNADRKQPFQQPEARHFTSWHGLTKYLTCQFLANTCDGSPCLHAHSLSTPEPHSPLHTWLPCHPLFIFPIHYPNNILSPTPQEKWWFFGAPVYPQFLLEHLSIFVNDSLNSLHSLIGSSVDAIHLTILRAQHRA